MYLFLTNFFFYNIPKFILHFQIHKLASMYQCQLWSCCRLQGKSVGYYLACSVILVRLSNASFTNRNVLIYYGGWKLLTFQVCLRSYRGWILLTFQVCLRSYGGWIPLPFQVCLRSYGGWILLPFQVCLRSYGGWILLPFQVCLRRLSGAIKTRKALSSASVMGETWQIKWMKTHSLCRYEGFIQSERKHNNL